VSIGRTTAEGPQDSQGLRILFVKTELGYPRSRGHDIRAFNMIRSMAELGHVIGLVTSTRPKDEAIKGLSLERIAVVTEGTVTPFAGRRFTRFQESLASYVGASRPKLNRVADEVRRAAGK